MCSVVMCFFFFIIASHAEIVCLESPIRVWTSSNGHKTEAKLLGISADGESVTLRNNDGKNADFKLKIFSEEDQRFIRSKQADFVQVSPDGKKATLRMLDGKRCEVQLTELTESSQEFIRKLKAPGVANDKNANPIEARGRNIPLDGRGIVVLEAKKQTANTFVLLVGINEYPAPVPSLDYCAADAQGLAKTLIDIGVPENQIILMYDKAKDVSLRPSLSNLKTQIERVTGLTGENDQLLISFSGHGAQIDNEPYLCPNDVNIDKRETFLSRKWVYDQIEGSRARKKLFIVDACRDKFDIKDGSRSLIGVKALGDPLGDKDSQGFAILSSCSPAQKSYEDNALKHGVFTFYIMEGLKGAADSNNDARITLDELYAYVSRETRNHVNKTKKQPQLPMKGGEFAGEFVLASLKQAMPLATQNPITVRPEDSNKPAKAAKPVFVAKEAKDSGFDYSNLSGARAFLHFGNIKLKNKLDYANLILKNVDPLNDARIKQAQAEVDKAQKDIENRRQEIEKMTFYDEYSFTVENVKNHGDGTSGIEINTTSPFRWPVDEDVLCTKMPSISGMTVDPNRGWGTAKAKISLSGNNADVIELRDDYRIYRIRVWFTGLRCDNVKFWWDGDIQSGDITAKVQKIEIVKLGDKL